MSRSIINTPTRSYLVSPDDPVPRERMFRVFVAGRPTDSATKRPVSATVTVAEPGFDAAKNVRWKEDNWFVIVGWIQWQLPLLPTTDCQLHIRMEAPGYWPANIVTTVQQPPPGQSPVMVELLAVETEMLRLP